MFGRGVFVIDQILRAGDEVVEHILLVRQIARLVPLLAILPPPRRLAET